MALKVFFFAKSGRDGFKSLFFEVWARWWTNLAWLTPYAADPFGREGFKGVFYFAKDTAFGLNLNM